MTDGKLETQAQPGKVIMPSPPYGDTHTRFYWIERMLAELDWKDIVDLLVVAGQYVAMHGEARTRYPDDPELAACERILLGNIKTASETWDYWMTGVDTNIGAGMGRLRHEAKLRELARECVQCERDCDGLNARIRELSARRAQLYDQVKAIESEVDSMELLL